MKLSKSSTVIMFSLMSVSLGCMKGEAIKTNNDENDYAKDETEVVNNRSKLEGISVENRNQNQDNISELRDLDEEFQEGENLEEEDEARRERREEINRLALKLKEELKKWRENKEREQNTNFSTAIYENSVPSSSSNKSENLIRNHELPKESGLNEVENELIVNTIPEEQNHSTVENELSEDDFDDDESIYEDSLDEPMMNQELPKESGLNEAENELSVNTIPEEQNHSTVENELSEDDFDDDESIYEDSLDEPMMNQELPKESGLNEAEKGLIVNAIIEEQNHHNVENWLSEVEFSNANSENIYENVEQGSLDEPIMNHEIPKESELNEAERELTVNTIPEEQNHSTIENELSEVEFSNANSENIYENVEQGSLDEPMVNHELPKESELNEAEKELIVNAIIEEQNHSTVENELSEDDFDDDESIYEDSLDEPMMNHELPKESELNEAERELTVNTIPEEQNHHNVENELSEVEFSNANDENIYENVEQGSLDEPMINQEIPKESELNEAEKELIVNAIIEEQNHHNVENWLSEVEFSNANSENIYENVEQGSLDEPIMNHETPKESELNEAERELTVNTIPEEQNHHNVENELSEVEFSNANDENIYEDVEQGSLDEPIVNPEIPKESELNEAERELTVNTIPEEQNHHNVENELSEVEFSEVADENIYEDVEQGSLDEPIVNPEIPKESELNEAENELIINTIPKEQSHYNSENELLEENFDEDIYEDIEQVSLDELMMIHKTIKENELNEIKKEPFKERNELEDKRFGTNKNLSEEIAIKNDAYSSEFRTRHKVIKDNEKKTQIREEEKPENQGVKQNLNEKTEEEELFKLVHDLLNQSYLLNNEKINAANKESKTSDLLNSENKFNQEQDSIKANINKLDLIEKNINNSSKTTNILFKKNEKNIRTSKKENLSEVHPNYLRSKTEPLLEVQYEMAALKIQLNTLREDNISSLNKVNDLVHILEQLEKKLDKVTLSESAKNYSTAKKEGETTKSSNKKLTIEPVELLLSICSLLYIYKRKHDF